MKIIYFLARYGIIGGAMHVMLKHAQIMKEKGHVIQIVFSDNTDNNQIDLSDYPYTQFDLPIRMCNYPVATSIEDIDIIESCLAYYRVEKLINDFHPDIIVSLHLNIAVEFASRKLHIPHLMEIYQINKGSFSIEWLPVFPLWLSSIKFPKELYKRKKYDIIRVTQRGGYLYEVRT